jgi:hypothetical protein
MIEAGDADVLRERERRLALWAQLKASGGPDGVAPELIKSLGIQRGQQGIYRDLERTRHMTTFGAGIAIGLRHTGSSYDDDLGEDGVLYHYPATSRGVRDDQEIQSLKSCAELRLPIFVVITPRPSATVRNVRLGWVADLDDNLKQVLVLFSERRIEPVPPAAALDTEPFKLTTTRSSTKTSLSIQRPGQLQFRHQVLARYGASCVFCPISEPKLLEAAHLRPVAKNGSDDPRNGLVLCLNHHKALDAGLLAVRPHKLEVVTLPMGPQKDALGVQKVSLEHLPLKPHPEAVKWQWEQWLKARSLKREDV